MNSTLRGIFLAGLLSRLVLAAQEKAPVWEPVRLADHLWELRTAGGGYTVKVLASIGPDGTLLVDSGTKGAAEALLEALGRLGGGRPKVIISSHAHQEHVAGNKVLGKGALIIGHAGLRSRLTENAYLFAGYTEDALPKVEVRDEHSLRFNGEEIRIRAFPGAHDPTDLVIHFTGSKVAHVGALVTAKKFPSVDSRGDILAYPEVSRKVLEWLPKDVRIVPGHGEDATVADGQQFLEGLAKTTEIVRAELAKGRTAGEMKKADLLRDFASWEVSYVSRGDFIDMLAEALTKKAPTGPKKPTLHAPLHEALAKSGPAGIAPLYDKLKAAGTYELDDLTMAVIGYHLSNADRPEEAVPFFELSVRDFPKGRFAALSHGYLGSIHQQAGRANAARSSFRRALEINPEDAQAKKGLAALGEEKPRQAAQLFEPGLVSTFMNDRDLALSPNGTDMFFGSLHRPVYAILHARRKSDGSWSRPEVAPFSGRWDDCEPAFSPDGRRLYFCSTRPLDGKGAPKDWDIWYVERTPSGWSEPSNPGAPLNSEKDEFYPSVTRDGTVYFISHDMKLWRSRRDGAGFAPPERLPETVNGAAAEYNACVSPDESVLVFTSHSWDQRFGQGDLVASFRKPNGDWTRPVNLGEAVNTDEIEMSPSLSPDGRTLFFSSNRQAKGAAQAKPVTRKELERRAMGPQNGLMDVYRVDAGVLDEAKASLEREETAIATAVDDGIGWFKTKDFDLLFRVHSAGEDLFMYQPRSTDTVRSGEEFRRFAEVFRKPGFTYLRHQVKDLRIHRARLENVAWFSALLDDCALIDGKEGCWTNARWTGVLAKHQGQWVIVNGHLSFTATPERATVAPEEARDRAAKSRDSLTPSGVHPEIEEVIRAGFAWAKTKDTALLFGTRTNDEDLFVYGPSSSKPVVGFQAFQERARKLWLTDAFRATGFDIRDVRIHLSPKGSVAWFSAVVEDWCEIGGTPEGWNGVRWTGVLEKRNGKWLYVQGHFSFSVDRPTAAAAAAKP